MTAPTALDALAGRAPYRPSCGSEGADFIDRWCGRCTHDDPSDDSDGCPIMGATFVFDVDDPAYPIEWREDGPLGPRCTGFDPMDPTDQPPCPMTGDLFARARTQDVE